MLKKIANYILNLKNLFIIVPFLFGLFYEFAVYVVAIGLLLIILIKLYKNKSIKIYFNFCFISVLILNIGYLLTCFYGIDKTDSLLGFFRIFTVLLFIIILMQEDKETIKNNYRLISISGVVMMIICVILAVIPATRNFVCSENGRLGGMFQYSNTFALFLLIGLIINSYSKEKLNKKIFIELILLLGIFWTGSRTIFLLTILFFVIYLFTNKSKNKWKLIIALIATAGIALGIAIITNNYENIGRFLTISINSSTLWGRIIYYQDAIELLKNNMFGYGYLGYSYVYPSVQTALYIVKFVHSDFLQIALDVGIIPMLIFIASIAYSIFSKKTSMVQKIILIIMSLHMVIDFDLQFLVIYFILIAMQDLTKQKQIEINVKKNILSIALVVILVLVYGYLMIGTFMNYIDREEISVYMIPNYTEANLELMKKEDLQNSNKLANKILRNNSYLSDLYYAKAIYELEKDNYDKMCEYQEKAINLNKYRKENYENYVLMLSKVLDDTVRNNEQEQTIKYAEKVLEIEEMLNNLKKNTNSLANRIQDDSNIVLNEQTNKYIENIKGVIKNVKIGQENY